jgi:fibronectin-binding autotransporter adhesin
MGNAAWIMVENGHTEVRNDNVDPLQGGDWNRNRTDLAVGYDFASFDLGGGTAVASLSFHILRSDAKLLDEVLASSAATVNAEGYGLGAGLAWYGAGGAYVDVQARATDWDADIAATTGGAAIEAESWGLSVEGGKRFALGAATALTPRLQAVLTDMRHDDFTDTLGLDVRQGNSDSLKVSAGLLFETTIQGGPSLFADLSVHHELRDMTSAIISGSEAFSGMSDTWGKLALGAAMPFGEHGSAYLAGHAARATGGGSGSGTEYGVQAGIRIEF